MASLLCRPQAQVASLQEQNDAAQGAAAAAQAEAEELRGALANMDSRLTSFHRKDAEVYARIKEAMEQAEQAKLARDASQGREVMLKHEVGIRPARAMTQCMRSCTFHTAHVPPR